MQTPYLLARHQSPIPPPSFPIPLSELLFSTPPLSLSSLSLHALGTLEEYAFPILRISPTVRVIIAAEHPMDRISGTLLVTGGEKNNGKKQRFVRTQRESVFPRLHPCIHSFVPSLQRIGREGYSMRRGLHVSAVEGRIKIGRFSGLRESS